MREWIKYTFAQKSIAHFALEIFECKSYCDSRVYQIKQGYKKIKQG